MIKNMGKADRTIRGFVIAPVLLVLSLVAVEPGSTVGIVLIALAAVMAGTAAIGTCPLYMPFGVSTCKNTEAHQ